MDLTAIDQIQMESLKIHVEPATTVHFSSNT